MGIQVNKKVGGGPASSGDSGIQLDELQAPDTSEALHNSKEVLKEAKAAKSLEKSLEQLLAERFGCCFRND